MNALAELQKRARPSANPANPANRQPFTAPDSRDSQDSQGVKAKKRHFVPVAASAAPAEIPGFLESIKGERERLLAVAEAGHVDADHVHRLHDLDVAGCLGLGERQLAAFLSMLEESAERHAGRVPAGHTAPIHCAGCGPVWAHPDIASVLPVVGGWPRALGCPWCFVRKAGGTIPRPSVVCNDCRHFTPDALNPEAGMGICDTGHSGNYSTARHACADHQPRDTAQNVPPIKRDGLDSEPLDAAPEIPR